MPRVKPDRVTPVASVDEADKALARIAEINRNLATIDAALNAKLDECKTNAAALAAGLQDELAQLTNGLEAFGESNRADLFPKQKTLELPHGFMGFRLSSSISISKKTMELLQAARKTVAIIVKKSVDKDVLKTWSDADLAEFKAKRVTEDKFWFEVKDEEVARRQP